MIITIGRQLGSGGHEIGKRLADALNMSFYDREIIEIAAQESGLNKQLFEDADECEHKRLIADTFALRFPYLNDSFTTGGGLSNETFFQIQSDVIRTLADKQSSVFIGRCADYILRDRQDCLNVFICADTSDRISRISQHFDLPANKARTLMESVDKKRAAYYNYYTNQIWGSACHYHFCINSSYFNIDGAVGLIRTLIDSRDS